MGNEASGFVEIGLEEGRLRGARRDGVLWFSGVPYARPPVGPLRFAPPEPPRPWTGTRDATRPMAIAPQAASRLAAVMGDFSREQDEDCLQLTIATPGVDGGHRPVIVWLHGGGFSSGGGGLDWYDGCRLAREGDVVVVGVNYRLGALGYLYADGLSPGNLGLLDQAQAIRFVREHARDFGGDPDAITLMGQSAGANAIAALFAGGHAGPGVRRAILQSGAYGIGALDTDRAGEMGERFLHHLGLADAPGRARDLSVAAILTAQGAVARETAQLGETAPPFHLLAHPPGLPADFHFDTLAADAMAGVEILLGVTARECQAFFARDPRMAGLDHGGAQARLQALYGDAAASDYARRHQARPDVHAADLFSDWISDFVFDTPTLRYADRASAAGASVYFYRFDWQAPASAFGSCHCLELPFLMGTASAWNGSPMLGSASPRTIERLSATMRAAWLAFARDGVPAAPSLPPWPRYARDTRLAMHLDDQPRAGSAGG
ncbi:carboxylesterase family protein [Pigmentiphaga sp.]|uniref:carboxylesterase/lipase family protein n=1 Tax=Pigmentiphaga sp. TaxID=1977564 RepID=UPI00128E0A9A|nr:carboxylesterase family protein [Pigmentiphaga sp.]MPS25414.1 hypothetical protein [Alcaligenaceae bacterium SAGV5]MPS54028.1 hypothetical protein [Alcaligenaceae bacterium SAGV3]MPT58727.1 hypothetical protein [Alcaligenaceae bacterium]